jgi:hypothetical protein
MSRRISQKRRQGISDAVDVSEQEVICDHELRAGPQPRRLVYRRLPGLITTGGVWPQKTHIACWYCRLQFTTQPIPIVQQYDATKNMYDVYGVACSGPCSKSYIMSLRNNDARTRLMWQTKMLIEVFGWPADEPIPAAHPWQALDVFGGYMTVQQWRRVIPDVKMQLKMPPFVPFVIFTETELKGMCQIDQTKPPEGLDHVDTLEEQAMQHGAAFSLKGLRRPETIISTVEQLAAAHPHHAVDMSPHGSVFGEFMATQTLPTTQECQNIRDQREADRRAKRKRKKPISAAEVPAESTLTDVMQFIQLPPSPGPVATVVGPMDAFVTHPRSPKRRVRK